MRRTPKNLFKIIRIWLRDALYLWRDWYRGTNKENK